MPDPNRQRLVVMAVIVTMLAASAWATTSADIATPVPVGASPIASPVLSTPAASPVPATPVSYTPSVPVHGAGYGEWSARYWQWLLSLPVGSNPAQDASGTSCAFGQGGPVFFVPPNMPPCTVPAGTAVMVHVAGDVCTTLEADRSTASERELRECAAEEADRYANISVRVDGEPVRDMAEHRVVSPAFAVNMPAHNVYGVTPGVGLAVSDGYWVILAPLLPGEHEVVVHVELADGLVLPDEATRLTVVDPARPVATPVG